MPLRFSQLFRAVPPTVEPVTVAEAKAQLRILHNEDDADLEFMIQVGREWAEDFCNTSFLYQSWVAQFSGWPEILDRTVLLPRPPLSVVELVRYRDSDDEWVELSEETDYVVDEIEGSIRFRSAFGFPVLSQDRVNPLEVVFRAGHGDVAEDVPLRLRQAVRLFVASNYSTNRHNRDVTAMHSVAEKLLANFRVRPL